MYHMYKVTLNLHPLVLRLGIYKVHNVLGLAIIHPGYLVLDVGSIPLKTEDTQEYVGHRAARLYLYLFIQRNGSLSQLLLCLKNPL